MEFITAITLVYVASTLLAVAIHKLTKPKYLLD